MSANQDLRYTEIMSGFRANAAPQLTTAANIGWLLEDNNVLRRSVAIATSCCCCYYTECGLTLFTVRRTRKRYTSYVTQSQSGRQIEETDRKAGAWTLLKEIMWLLHRCRRFCSDIILKSVTFNIIIIIVAVQLMASIVISQGIS